MNRDTRPALGALAFLLCLLMLAFAACESVQFKPKGEIVTGVSVGSRR